MELIAVLLFIKVLEAVCKVSARSVFRTSDVPLVSHSHAKNILTLVSFVFLNGQTGIPIDIYVIQPRSLGGVQGVWTLPEIFKLIVGRM